MQLDIYSFLIGSYLTGFIIFYSSFYMILLYVNVKKMIFGSQF
jgi:hypothetical protein